MSDRGHLYDPEQAVPQEIAAGHHESVISLIFQAGLAATSVLSRTAEAYTEAQLAFIVTTLDDALAEMRSAIFKMMAPADPATTCHLRPETPLSIPGLWALEARSVC